jgi:hypothetical protein
MSGSGSGTSNSSMSISGEASLTSTGDCLLLVALEEPPFLLAGFFAAGAAQSQSQNHKVNIMCLFQLQNQSKPPIHYYHQFDLHA